LIPILMQGFPDEPGLNKEGKLVDNGEITEYIHDAIGSWKECI